jgi:alpha-1,2-mannosyltransferase
VPARGRRATIVAVVLLAVGWCSAGLAPLGEAAAEALAPTDFTRDFVTAHFRAHHGRQAPPTESAGNAYAASIGAPEVVPMGGPYYLHPGPALLLMLALVPLGYRGAAAAWLALSLVALAALAFGLVALADPRGRPRWKWGAVTFLTLLLWPPSLHNLAKGQWSILLAALVTLGWRALAARRGAAAGAWLGAAASLKLTPLLLGGYLALRERRAAAVMVAVTAAATAGGLAVTGVEYPRAFLTDMPRDVAAWQTWVANTASLNGLLARLLAGGPFARPLAAAPALARALNLGASLAFVTWAAAATWRAPAGSARAQRALGAAWLALAVLLNPLAWTHTALLALPSLALLRGIAPPATLLAALALMSVPRQTLAALAGPTPVGPATAPLLSLHAAGLCLIVVTALRRAARPDTMGADPE